MSDTAATDPHNASQPPAGEALVNAYPHPAKPGLTSYAVSAMTREAVQKAILDIMDGMANGTADFTNPRQIHSGIWNAVGETRTGEALNG